MGLICPCLRARRASHLDYLYNDGNPSNNAFKPYDHSLSLWHQGFFGPFGLGVDLTAAHGIEGNESVLGLTVLATCAFGKDLIRHGDALEAVLRYQYAVSDGENGLQLQSRYEQKVVPGGLGDAYQAIYAGINYLIYGNRLKLMTGAEYSVMKDSTPGQDSFDGWTYLAGVRLFFLEQAMLGHVHVEKRLGCPIGWIGRGRRRGVSHGLRGILGALGLVLVLPGCSRDGAPPARKARRHLAAGTRREPHILRRRAGAEDRARRVDPRRRSREAAAARAASSSQGAGNAKSAGAVQAARDDRRQGLRTLEE